MLEQMIAGNGFPKVVVENDHCRVVQMMGGNGDGSMTQYDLYPGITLMYNDFHMEDYDSDLTITGDLLCIDYCRQGRIDVYKRQPAIHDCESQNICVSSL